MTEYSQLAHAIMELDRKLQTMAELERQNHDQLQSIGHVVDSLIYTQGAMVKEIQANRATRRH